MRTAFRWIFRLFLLALLAVILLIAHALLFKPLKPDWFYERVFMEYGVDDPQMLSSMRMLPSWMDWYSDDLTDQSLAQERKMQAKLKQDLATLREYDRKGRRRKVRASQLSVEPAVRHPERVPDLHGHPASGRIGSRCRKLPGAPG